jgi:hypothetical protein
LFDSLEAMGVNETDLPESSYVRLKESLARVLSDPTFESNRQQESQHIPV